MKTQWQSQWQGLGTQWLRKSQRDHLRLTSHSEPGIRNAAHGPQNVRYGSGTVNRTTNGMATRKPVTETSDGGDSQAQVPRQEEPGTARICTTSFV